MYINDVPKSVTNFPSVLRNSSMLWASQLVKPLAEDVIAALTNPFALAVNKIAKKQKNSFAMLYKHGDWEDEVTDSLKKYRTAEAINFKENLGVQDYYLQYFGFGGAAGPRAKPTINTQTVVELVSYMLTSIAQTYAFKYLFRIPWTKSPAEMISLENTFSTGLGIFSKSGLIKDSDKLFRAIALAEFLIGLVMLPKTKVVLTLGQQFLSKIGVHFIMAVVNSLIMNPLTAGLRDTSGNIATTTIGELYQTLIDSRSKRNVYSVTHGILARRYESLETMMKQYTQIDTTKDIFNEQDSKAMLTLMRWGEAFFDASPPTFPEDLRDFLEDVENEATNSAQDWTQIGSEITYLFRSAIISRETSNRMAAAAMGFIYEPIARYLSPKDGTYQIMTTGWLLVDSINEIQAIMNSDMGKRAMQAYQMTPWEFIFANLLDPDTYPDRTKILTRFSKSAYVIGKDFWRDLKEAANKFETQPFEDVISYLTRGVSDKIKNLQMEIRKFNPFSMREHKEIIGG